MGSRYIPHVKDIFSQQLPITEIPRVRQLGDDIKHAIKNDISHSSGGETRHLNDKGDDQQKESRTLVITTIDKQAKKQQRTSSVAKFNKKSVNPKASDKKLADSSELSIVNNQRKRRPLTELNREDRKFISRDLEKLSKAENTQETRTVPLNRDYPFAKQKIIKMFHFGLDLENDFNKPVDDINVRKEPLLEPKTRGYTSDFDVSTCLHSYTGYSGRNNPLFEEGPVTRTSKQNISLSDEPYHHRINDKNYFAGGFDGERYTTQTPESSYFQTLDRNYQSRDEGIYQDVDSGYHGMHGAEQEEGTYYTSEGSGTSSYVDIDDLRQRSPNVYFAGYVGNESAHISNHKPMPIVTGNQRDVVEDVLNDAKLRWRSNNDSEVHGDISKPVVFKDYGGEDFSKYFSDEDNNDEVQQENTTTLKRQKRKKQASRRSSYIHEIEGNVTPSALGHTATLKKKLNKIFIRKKKDKEPVLSHKEDNGIANRLRNFSFADSKLSTIDRKWDEKRQPVDDVKTSHMTHSWWSPESVGASPSNVNSDVTLSRRLVPVRRAEIVDFDMNQNKAISTPSENDWNFEQQRKYAQYDPHRQQKKVTIVRKISSRVAGSRPPRLGNSVTAYNPLSMHESLSEVR